MMVADAAWRFFAPRSDMMERVRKVTNGGMDIVLAVVEEEAAAGEIIIIIIVDEGARPEEVEGPIV